VGELRAKGEVFQGVFVKDSMDDESFGGFFEVNTVLSGTVAKESAVGAANRAEAVRMFLKKVSSEDIEFPKDLDLERGGQLSDFGGAGGSEDDLEGGHVRKNLTGKRGVRSRLEAMD
jgi:hypothetical protein